MGGDNISIVAIETSKCYFSLINESEMFQNILKSCEEQLS
jgi:hypothetical protein